MNATSNILPTWYDIIQCPQSFTWNLRIMIFQKKSPFPGVDFQVPGVDLPWCATNKQRKRNRLSISAHVFC